MFSIVFDPDQEIWLGIYVFCCRYVCYGRYSVPILIAAAIAPLLGALYYLGEWIPREW